MHPNQHAPTKAEVENARRLLEDHLHEVRKIVTAIAARKRLSPDRREELASFVSLKLLENDCARIRRFRGNSSLKTYLTIVIQRLFLDFQRLELGTWRSSARARRLGPAAQRLERLLRDGSTFEEAYQRLQSEGITIDRDDLWKLAESLPTRQRPRLCELEAIGAERLPDSVSDPEEMLVASEQEELRRRLETSIQDALVRLPPHDALVLRMWFERSLTAPEIAVALRIQAREVYSIVQRSMNRVRRHLAASRMDGDEIRELLHLDSLSIELFAAIS
jgi:RNA polymerase sigma factor (sigma-70 family)